MSTKKVPAAKLTVGTWIVHQGKHYEITGIEPEHVENGREYDYRVDLRRGPSLAANYNTMFVVVSDR
ncbi:hypothetical protein M8C13_36290 [Crossiella sp. SN42]|uniref:hypothetical protein n=1 Tax=Crossiella sp. SN42 TaxID=2944808 RepID=UPI00207CFF00|nr:hypothetical protein [Crossiella sp. SN42]MCO1581224.1 hypothetical protein [Crossiella sp. SN42]